MLHCKTLHPGALILPNRPNTSVEMLSHESIENRCNSREQSPTPFSLSLDIIGWRRQNDHGVNLAGLQALQCQGKETQSYVDCLLGEKKIIDTPSTHTSN